ncbi:unnamed protein product [Ixodes pacificus]
MCDLIIRGRSESSLSPESCIIPPRGAVSAKQLRRPSRSGDERKEIAISNSFVSPETETEYRYIFIRSDSTLHCRILYRVTLRDTRFEPGGRTRFPFIHFSLLSSLSDVIQNVLVGGRKKKKKDA